MLVLVVTMKYPSYLLAASRARPRPSPMFEGSPSVSTMATFGTPGRSAAPPNASVRARSRACSVFVFSSRYLIASIAASSEFLSVYLQRMTHAYVSELIIIIIIAIIAIIIAIIAILIIITIAIIIQIIIIKIIVIIHDNLTTYTIYLSKGRVLKKMKT